MKLVYSGTEVDGIKIPVTSDTTFGDVRRALLQLTVLHPIYAKYFTCAEHYTSYAEAVAKYMEGVTDEVPMDSQGEDFIYFELEDINQCLVVKILQAEGVCPGCGSPKLSQSNKEFADGYGHLKVTCDECSIKWREVYQLTNAQVQ